ncbi:MAG: hypothetical protein JO372_09950 [Solirubrobacterales bacterium]|nr:hypothetical protein [Solirubrobacterales bacterium]
MFGLGLRRGVRVFWGALAVVIGVGVAVPVALGGVGSSSARNKLAARLMRLDPGKPVGGKTQVATAPRQRLVGAPGRVNFMMALGSREVIVGGARHDELGALGNAAKIYGGAGPDLIHGGPGNEVIDGGPGNDLIYAGPGNDVIYGGPGNDAIYGNKRGHTTAFPGSGTNTVNVANGHGGDRVMCAPGSINHITADRSDRIAPSCRRAKASTVRYVRLPSGRATGRAAQASGPQRPVARAAQGNGSDASPYTAECNPPEPASTDCAVALWQQTLSGLWTHAGVPAMQCPASHPWLVNQDYTPFGTSVPNGVSVQGLGPIGIFISADFTDANGAAVGTLTDKASATNWTTGTNTYTVYLHCTHNTGEAYPG